jgi:hypothetical protein
MAGWTDLKVNELGNWLASQRDVLSHLPIFQLRPQSTTSDDLRWTILEQRSGSGDRVERRRRLDSGIVELRFMQERSRWVSEFDAIVSSVVRAEDNRRKISQSTLESEVVPFEYETTLNDLGDLSVVGPGGRIIVTRQHAPTQAFSADIVVRPRMRSISSEWRDNTEVARHIIQRMEAYSQGPAVERIAVQFGYLELSKYESQSWMRPVALVSFPALMEHGRVKWIATIAEPVTTAKEIDLFDGLGNLAE